ncbi:barstar family protein [Nocardioides litoris]|uniref:barstar family protein n=1 Tax=Nocardioides litoris TaxID=1926648 RepID=UPI00147700FD|nr:barstar family protein [Nocardioides litoris]
MSGLAGLLAGRVAPGAWTWRATYDAEEVRRAVEGAGRPFAHLDGVRVESVPELHGALAEALGFPEWYGRNLDALAECLRDVPAETVLLWDSWAPLARAEPRVFTLAVDLLGERLSVLLRGEGPPTALPVLD